MLLRARAKTHGRVAQPNTQARRSLATTAQAPAAPSSANTFIWTSAVIKPYLGMGTVPYEFTKQAVLKRKISEIQGDLVQLGVHKHFFTWAVASDWYRLPYSKQEYTKVFEIKDENKVDFKQWFAGNLRVLNLAQDILRDGQVSKRLMDDDLEDRAWVLYKKFRFLATEQDSIFGFEDRSTDGLTQVRPTPYAGACLLPINPARVHFWELPTTEQVTWNFKSVIDFELKAPAIDYFRAYVAAFDAVAQGRVPNLVSLNDLQDKVFAKKAKEDSVARFKSLNDEIDKNRKQTLQEIEAYLDGELKRQ